MDLGALDGGVPKLCELGFACDEFVLKFGDLLELHGGLAFGVEHLFFVAVGGKGEGGCAGSLLGLGDLRGGELDQVLAGTGVEVVDEFFAQFQEGFVDPMGVLGAEGADGEERDAGGGIGGDGDVLLVVAMEGFEGLVSKEVGEAVQGEGFGRGEGLAQREAFQQDAEGIPGGHEVVDGERVVVGTGDGGALDDGAQAGGGFDLGAADDKTRLGNVDVGSEEGEVSCGEGGRKEDGEEKEGVARKPRKEATQEARGA